ncbi:hypothetical protein CEP54_008875 [Fusarium duplospermum]|uniref:Uncharacterized protein n=1 Tax=Fusarium duplospermum TaxID=1325734 RepID=A0A428PTQ4_9HYPO|nr:hypothetical protein CEP54_008875 [Fusarium duplospermum]
MTRSSPSTFIRPGLEAAWHQKMRRRLAWLRDIGVMGKVHLDVDFEGLPTFHGMPPCGEVDFLPPVTGPELVALALKDPRNHPLMGGLVTILKGIDPDTHVAWKKALAQLEALHASNTIATASDVLAILIEAKVSYVEDRDGLSHFLFTARKNPRYVMSQEEPAIPWLAQCMARMFGIDAPLEPDENWWATAREHLDLGADSRFFTLTDMVWRRMRVANKHPERDVPDRMALIAAENVVELVYEFRTREKNMLICKLVEDNMFEPIDA